MVNPFENREITVLAQDPDIKHFGRILTTTVRIPSESLAPGPSGARVQVVDFDTRTGTLYKPHQKGLYRDRYTDADDDTLLNDPNFHAQNVYALAMVTLHRFEAVLGRHVSWTFAPSNAHQLKIAPHAFMDANAFYSRDDQALAFGYFRNNRRKKWIFTCLSHDIIVHETTHALLDSVLSQIA